MEQFEETRTEALILLRKENEELIREICRLRAEKQELNAEVIQLSYQLKKLIEKDEISNPISFPTIPPHETI